MHKHVAVCNSEMGLSESSSVFTPSVSRSVHTAHEEIAYVHWIKKYIYILLPLRQLPRFLGYYFLTGTTIKDIDRFTILSAYLLFNDRLYIKTRKFHGHKSITVCLLL